MLNFSGSGHPSFRASSAFERGDLRSKGGGKKSTHFNGTLISANQLSIFGTIATSLFQENTVSWVRIVNGVEYVTESMPTAKKRT